MTVSVVITTCRRKPAFIIRALRSVMTQTYQNIEIIVVDDSPPDYQEREHVREAVLHTCPSVRYISHGKNMGAPAARNTGLRMAKGDYIAFLDDDDEWLPEKIENQLLGFTANKVALVYCGYIIVDEMHFYQCLPKMKYISGDVFDVLLQESNFIGTTSIPLMKKACLDSVGGFDEAMEARQDYDLYIRLAKKYEVNFIPKTLVKYHVHDGDRISADPSKRINGQIRLLEKYADDLEKRPHSLVLQYRLLILLYRKMGRIEEAIGVWLRSVKKCPYDLPENVKYLLYALLDSDFILFLWYRLIIQKMRNTDVEIIPFSKNP